MIIQLESVAKNSDGKKVKKVKATCNICDEMHKSMFHYKCCKFKEANI